MEWMNAYISRWIFEMMPNRVIKMVIGVAMTGLKFLVNFTTRKCEING
jgi:hypothetical protein